MVRIELVTRIAAPIEQCFDLSRSIDLHMASTDWTGERAIAGTTSGLIGEDQQVTWQGRHFGLKIRHTSLISVFDPPWHFQDCMVRGAFASFCHNHYFESISSETRMTDSMQVRSAMGIGGTFIRRRAGPAYAAAVAAKEPVYQAGGGVAGVAGVFAGGATIGLPHVRVG